MYVYRLDDGALVRSFGGRGTGQGQFDFAGGGMCATVTNTVLVAEFENVRLQEVCSLPW